MRNQLQMHTLDLLPAQNRRAPDTEAAALNARLFQVRLGVEYGQALSIQTAENVGRRRQP